MNGLRARVLSFLLSELYRDCLSPCHRADLAKSGLTTETIVRHRIRSVPPTMISQLLGFDIPAIQSAMLIPFPNPAGGFTNHVRMKIFPPLTDRDGHTVKYLQPRRSGVKLFFSLATLAEVVHGLSPLWLVEGEKKCLAVAQLGLPAVGMCGIEGWHAAGASDLLPDFRLVSLVGRTVNVLPDGDWQTNPSVYRSARKLVDALEAAEARVQLMRLPDEVKA